MSKANTVGSLFQENYLAKDRGVTGTDAIVIVSPALDDIDGISFQIKTAGYSQPLLVEAGDELVVAAEGTWTFANGAFHADMVGGDIIVTGADDPLNNGTFEITAVNSATEIETAAGTLVSEVFTDTVNVTVVGPVDPLQVTFTVEISDNYSRGGISGLAQPPHAGDWGPVTTKFANTGSPFFPAIAAITVDGAPYYQMTPLMGRFVRWTVTPSGGIGNLSFLYSAKGNR